MIVSTKWGAVGLDSAGDGVPMLLLHGFPMDRSLWAPQVAVPIAGIRMIAPDLPGFGESHGTDVPSMDEWADWTADLLDALRLDRVILGGLSMGGYLCLAMWRRHPERVRALVLADTRAGADSEEARGKRREMQQLVMSEGTGAVAEKMIPGLVGKTTRASRPDVVATLDAMMRRASVTGVHDALDALRTRPDSTSILAGITVPTLIVCGEEDVLTPPAESRALHAAIAGSRLGIIPQAGHASNIESADAFNRLLSEFARETADIHTTS
ncbi:MAG TPA: alpha/beta fold hydrolase [Gemmatimonadaceae bacterium]|nr:alpha/beta fold hydrolase [Gemmatimonadaceae bacterium]